MKKLFATILSLMLCLATVIGLVACGDGHKHAFNVKNSSADYLASSATCTDKAKYYYSCECGEKGSETFEVGSPAHDYIDHVCKIRIKYEKNINFFWFLWRWALICC